MGINEHVGCRFSAASGNSEVGVEMPKWVTKMTAAPRRSLIVGRTESECEYAYDRKGSRQQAG